MNPYAQRPRPLRDLFHGLEGSEKHFSLLSPHKDNFLIYQEIEQLKQSGVKSVKKITDQLADSYLWFIWLQGYQPQRLKKSSARRIYDLWVDLSENYPEIREKILTLTLDPSTYNGFRPKQYVVPTP